MSRLKILLFVAFCIAALTSCSDDKARVKTDGLNSLSYNYHYRDLSKTKHYATEALKSANGYNDGIAEAYNNLAFVSIAQMNYAEAKGYLTKALDITDNLVEQLIASIQMMRLCQRQSQNKEFYIYKQAAEQRMRRIKNNEESLNQHQRERFVYAESEYGIVASTYFYYVGLEGQAAKMLNTIDANGPIVKDTAQLLNYYYNIGSGGIITDGTSQDIHQEEFNYLVRCYLLSRQYNYPFWEANSLQAISEHLIKPSACRQLIHNNPQETVFLNVDNMPDSLLAGNLAYRSLLIFKKFGDIYQIAGSYRTLAQCYWAINDYRSALICLNNSLQDRRVEHAPDLVASIREKLSLVYSAIDDKKSSDYNRNIYLDLQENTRQDRQLEARADMLEKSSMQLNAMIVAVCLLIVLVVVLLLCIDHKRRKDTRMSARLAPEEHMEQWRKATEEKQRQMADEYQEAEERLTTAGNELERYKTVNLEQRSKVSLVNSIIPLIDRIIQEIDKLTQRHESDDVRSMRYKYIIELANKINEYNDSLTRWIKMKQGDVRLHVESFCLQDVFNVVMKTRSAFAMQGISLDVLPTTAMVKADKALTLFMVNTIVENARRYTPAKGKVEVRCEDKPNCVEIVVEDTGTGMTEHQVATLFDNKPVADDTSGRQPTGNSAHVSHGFGLLNCKGIIEKYKKTSSIFSVCGIHAESTPGKGTTFRIDLPKGMKKALAGIVLMTVCATSASGASISDRYIQIASQYADSAYFSNIAAQYAQTLAYADSCRKYLNLSYLQTHHGSQCLMSASGDNPGKAAEITWYRSRFKCNYNIILDMRNESAVASLALHDWDRYTYNNKVYTQLFRESSADSTLADYVLIMQKAESNKNIAIFMLVVLLLSIFPIYYLLYYRHKLYYRNALEKVMAINQILIGTKTSESKLSEIRKIWKHDKEQRSTADMERLNTIVAAIEESLASDIKTSEQYRERMRGLKEDIHRMEYEKNRYYISNNVLENCLSALKHETMYYPSRIKQLAEETGNDIGNMHDVAYYYRELYSILSQRAMSSVTTNQRVDYALVDHLFDIIRQINGGDKPKLSATSQDKQYVRISTVLDALTLTHSQIVDLFTPSTTDFRFLICRQIVREFGEQTNARGCGIQASSNDGGGLLIEITLTHKIWKHSKLS